MVRGTKQGRAKVVRLWGKWCEGCEGVVLAEGEGRPLGAWGRGCGSSGGGLKDKREKGVRVAVRAWWCLMPLQEHFALWEASGKKLTWSGLKEFRKRTFERPSSLEYRTIPRIADQQSPEILQREAKKMSPSAVK